LQESSLKRLTYIASSLAGKRDTNQIAGGSQMQKGSTARAES